jgi:hypothetical protein
MTEAATGLTPPIYILMKGMEDDDISFLDVRSSVQEAERVLASCREDPPEGFLYFDDRGQPLDAVRTSKTSITLRPRDEAPDKELLWEGVRQALSNMEQYLRTDPQAVVGFDEPFDTFKAAIHQHQVNPDSPVASLPKVYGADGLCCAIFKRWCCACTPDDGDGEYKATGGG